MRFYGRCNDYARLEHLRNAAEEICKRKCCQTFEELGGGGGGRYVSINIQLLSSYRGKSSLKIDTTDTWFEFMARLITTQVDTDHSVKLGVTHFQYVAACYCFTLSVLQLPLQTTRVSVRVQTFIRMDFPHLLSRITILWKLLPNLSLTSI